MEIIEINGRVFAIIIRNSYKSDGVDFITPNEYSQQVAIMHHPTGKKIDAHIHNVVKRDILITQEVLIIKNGKLRVDFYENPNCYFESVLLKSGDIILLVSGGHGFKVIEEVDMIEVKQGPYAGEMDKIRFEGIADSDVIFNMEEGLD